MKKLHTVFLLLGAGFLFYLVWRTGAGELYRELASLGWGLFPLIMCEGLAEFIHVAGWRYCLNGAHRSLPVARLFGIRMAGYAINYLTPTAALGGEVTKAALLGANGRRPDAVSGVLIGKVCFALAHLLFVLLGSVVILRRIQLPAAWWSAMLIGSLVVGAGMVGFLLVQKHGQLGAVVRWLAARKRGGRRLEQFAEQISTVDEALKDFYRQRPGDLLRAICWHLLGYSVGIFQTWLFLKLLNQEVSWTLAACIWFLGMWFDLVTFAMPLNLGTLEGTRIVTFRAVGLGSLTGLTSGVALRLAQIFWSAIGLALYGWLARQTVCQPSPIPALSRGSTCVGSGGPVLKTSLSPDDKEKLQAALVGAKQ